MIYKQELIRILFPHTPRLMSAMTASFSFYLYLMSLLSGVKHFSMSLEGAPFAMQARKFEAGCRPDVGG